MSFNTNYKFKVKFFAILAIIIKLISLFFTEDKLLYTLISLISGIFLIIVGVLLMYNVKDKR